MELNYTKSIDVRYDVDVFIAGGGPAGVAAAVSCAREGRSVFVAESFSAFGGAAVTMLIPAYMCFGDGINFCADGIGKEIFDRLKVESPERYKRFCPSSIPVETLKLMTVSRSELMRHVEFRGTEAIEKSFDQGKPCAAILGHYCNWELLTAIGLTLGRHREAVIGLVYTPKTCKLLDRLFIKIRQNMGGVCVPKQDILRYLVQFRRQGVMNIFGYIADQSPKYQNIHLWLPFLGHDTPVFTGAERIMRKMDNTVFYIDVERPARGKYVYTFKPMTDKPGELPEYEITRRFFAMLEQTIRRNPSCYLWSHNRWKRTHEEYDRRVKN